MTRTLTAGMQTEVAAQRGTIAYFIQLDSSGGTIRITTAPVDVAWDSQTWEGIGGLLSFGGVEEGPEASGQGVQLTLSGVDQTIIAALLNNDVRGREVRIWLAHISDLGAVVADPAEIFRGFQNDDYRISETRDPVQAGTVTVETRIQSRLSVLAQAIAVRTNEISHNDMLKRASLTTGDTFFRNVGAVVGGDIRWGMPWPYHIGNNPSRGTAKKR